MSLNGSWTSKTSAFVYVNGAWIRKMKGTISKMAAPFNEMHVWLSGGKP